MAFDKILHEFQELCEERSTILKRIKSSENEITSITERLEDLKAQPQTTQEYRDQVSRARDKRKRLREEIAHDEHEARLFDAKIEALKMKAKWLIEYEFE